ncbi:MAG: hypothetical protein ABMA64_17685 [Myxococcota bacterium]
MFRLTVRSCRDGRIAARIIQRDGELFVLDWGDPVVVADAARRILTGGFEVEWDGSERTATPDGPALLGQLALHYASHGWLVFADEPGWAKVQRGDGTFDGEDRDVTERLSASSAPPKMPLLVLPTGPDAEDTTTEEVTLMPTELRAPIKV